MFGPEDNFEIEREPDKPSQYKSREESDGYSSSEKPVSPGGYRDIELDENKEGSK